MILHKEISDIIINSFYQVYNDLGYGFLEKVYENALFVELSSRQLDCRKQAPIDVFYKGANVGIYFADLIVQDIIILELKSAVTISEAHGYQLINYLKATDIEVGLLLNFGKSPEFKRKIYLNINK